MALDKKSAVQILNSRKLITKVGKVTLRCTSTSPFQREDGTLVQIVNFNAMTGYQLGEAKKLFSNGDYDGACNLNMSASQLQGRYVPSKGETVDVEISEVGNKDGVTILVVDSVIPRVAETAPSIKFSMDGEDDDTLSEEEMRVFLVKTGEFTAKQANKLVGADLVEAYTEASVPSGEPTIV